MPDVQLAQVRDRSDRADIRVAERVARVRAHARGADKLDRAPHLRKLGGRSRVASAKVMVRMGIRPRVDLAEAEPRPRRRRDLPLIRVDERAHRDPRALEPRDRLADAPLLPRDIEPALGRHLGAPLGHEHGQLRPQRDRDRHHLVGRRHLEVELGPHDLLQPREIGVLDVPTVLAQVHGDSVGAAGLGFGRRKDGVGLVGPPGLPDGRDMVDVDAEFRHG